MDKIDKKRKDKKLCLLIGLWIIVYVLGRRLLLVPKNNENAIFIINIRPPKSLHKKQRNYFFTEIQFNINDFLEKSGEDYNG